MCRPTGRRARRDAEHDTRGRVCSRELAPWTHKNPLNSAAAGSGCRLATAGPSTSSTSAVVDKDGPGRQGIFDDLKKLFSAYSTGGLERNAQNQRGNVASKSL